ncbi:MAG: hypothetical protein K0B08_11000 [Bacteroidales bacterium]|nr:hypothetical protein [Bacteroidales bacterium]
MIHVYYDLSGDGEYDVKIYCSQDSGVTWGNPLTQVTGAVGKGQRASTNKKITWNVLAEKDRLQGDVKFKVEAISGFDCGKTITVNHRAGDVAAVTKTVTYGTVTNIPGEPSKCWITQNLGADRQATSVSEAAEAPAGWYWQFNRKQGYKHDGTTRMPNTAWVSSIRENSSWQAANDPCTIELGSGWRIPTYTEWINVMKAGDWSSWKGPWNSVLKLHAAGYLSFSDGSLYVRGSFGYSWSSTQNDTSYGRYLTFGSSSCYMYASYKASGSTLRCLRD